MTYKNPGLSGERPEICCVALRVIYVSRLQSLVFEACYISHWSEVIEYPKLKTAVDGSGDRGSEVWAKEGRDGDTGGANSRARGHAPSSCWIKKAGNDMHKWIPYSLFTSAATDRNESNFNALLMQDGSLFSVLLILWLSIYPSVWYFGASHITVQKAMSQRYFDAIKSSLILLSDLQEQLRITEAAEKAKQEDARVLEVKKAAGAALLRDVMAGNAAMIERKKDEKIREILEEQRIAAFVKERDAKAQVCLTSFYVRSVAPDPQSSHPKWN